MNKARSDFGLDAMIGGDLRAFFDRNSGVDRVWIFGSRAREDEHARSDVDLAVDAPHMDSSAFEALRRGLEKLLFVRKIELVHWQTVSDDRFRREIETERKVFWERVGRKAEVA